MKQITLSPGAFSPPTRAFENSVTAPGVVSEAASQEAPCLVFSFEDHATPAVETPPRHTPINELVDKWSKDEKRRALLEQARHWVADTLHAESGDTVRTLRLRKGLSQTQVAQALGTSQPHVARIERGTENLYIGTCRRLCQVLEIDMNTLDQALRRQEANARAKTKS